MSSNSSVGGELTTHAIMTTFDGKEINLGILDYRTGIKANVFGKPIDLTFPWTPRLWFYKHITYRLRQIKQKRNK